jgi:hypothetical protein
MRILFLLLILLPTLWGSAGAQVKEKGPNDTLAVGRIVLGADTLAHAWLREVTIRAKAPRWLVKQRRRERRDENAYSQLRYNVYKVYPYAVAASFILHDVDSVLALLQSKEAKKQYKLRKEAELNRQFKDELTNMTISQGQVLVKLIARQTGKPCYEIVKELKGGFNATLWQAVALLFSNNLKSGYDPEGEDAAIEGIVQEIEARGHFERIPGR